MAKKILIFFDGTKNDPGDAAQEIEEHGGIEDDGISNVLKLYFLMGGRLMNLNHSGDVAADGPLDPSSFDDQICFYFQGVGSYGGPLRKLLNGAFSPPLLDVRRIMRGAITAIEKTYEPGDEIFVFGFSRGSAIARRFAGRITKHVAGMSEKPVRFMGVFDTVAQIGKPEIGSDDLPDSKVVFEDGNRVSENVTEALHMVSLDERRNLFPPTLMADDDRITEIWFPGVHSDVGGGYFFDGLSDVTLSYLLDEVDRRGLGVQTRSPQAVAEEEFEDDEYGLDADDIEIKPTFLSKLHWHDDWWRVEKLVISDREIQVLKTDVLSASRDVPLIHHTARDLVRADHDYEPAAISDRLTCEIVGPDGKSEGETAFDLGTLREEPSLGARHLNLQGTVTVEVFATQKYCPTGLRVAAGERYEFQPVKNSFWYDASIKCDAWGWKAKDKLGLARRIVVALMEGSRRHPDAEWFELLATVGRNDQNVLRAVERGVKNHEMPSNGELFMFPNDLSGKYGNNRGSILVRVRRVA
jgi:type VI secretion system (T6SS) phospholipase Tle1-like effector